MTTTWIPWATCFAIVGAGTFVISPVVASVYVVVATWFIVHRCARRFRPRPYDWPTWVYRVLLTIRSTQRMGHR